MDSTSRLRKHALCLIIGTVVSSATPALGASEVPDAGQSLKGLPPLSPFTPRLPELIIDNEAQPENPQGGGEAFFVKSIRVSGNTKYANDILEALVSDLAGTKRTLAEIKIAASRITRYYRDNGYLVARAYIPDQIVDSGVIKIAVLEGRLGKLLPDNQSRVSDAQINSHLDEIKEDDVIKAEPVDRALLLLSDTPGVSGVRGIMRPGASPGTSNLFIELQPSTPYLANITADNYGNTYSGKNRVSATLNVNSPLRQGDLLDIQFLSSGPGLKVGLLGWQIPVPHGDGLRLGTSYTETHYRLGERFAILNAHGSAAIRSLFASYPIVRTQRTNLSSVLRWEDKRLRDQIDAIGARTDKRARAITLGVNGSYLGSVAQSRSMSSFDLSLLNGKLKIDSPEAFATDDASARTNGSYTRWAYSVSHLQELSARNALYVACNGQHANKNLDSSEKLTLGGPQGVRAYPVGEASGDTGWQAHVEWRYRMLDSLQSMFFYDAGRVNINQNPFRDESNARKLSGAGVGLRASLNGFQLNTSVAWRTGKQLEAEHDSHPIFWVQLSAAF